MSAVRMTASLAERLFRTASPITAAEIHAGHLDMLQLDMETSRELRADLGDAEDWIRAGNRSAIVVQRAVAAFNARAGR